MPLFDLKKKQPQSQNNNNEKEEPENPIIRELAKHILSEVVQHEGEVSSSKGNCISNF